MSKSAPSLIAHACSHVPKLLCVRVNAANLEYAINTNDAHHRPFLQTTRESINCLYARQRHALT